MHPRVISLVRHALLGSLVLFSLITLGLSGHLVSITAADGFIEADASLALAVSIITMGVVVPAVVIDFLRQGAFTSMVAVELGWSFVLMVLWTASAGHSTASIAGISCNSVFVDGLGDVFPETSIEQGTCHEAQAIVAFSWLNFFIILAWVGMLTFFAITSHSRGNTGAWTQSVTNTDFFARKEGMGQPQTQYAGASPNAYGTPPPMQQQYTGAPVQPQHTGMPGHYTPPPKQQPAAYPPTGYATEQV